MSNAPTLASRTLSLPAFRLDDLTAALEKLGKKAVKLGCAKPTYKVVKEYKVNVSEDNKFPQWVGYCDLEITYEVLAVAGGWRFLASIETVDQVDGVNRNRVNGPGLDGEVAKGYITVAQKCDHCGHNRRRNQTYIVQNEAGETKQIGSTCLKEYMGVDPVSAVAGLAFDAAIKEIGEDEERWGGARNGPRVWELGEVAAAALSLISHNGFVSAAQAEFDGMVKTGADMLTLLLKSNPKLSEWYAKMEPTAANREAAEVIVERLNARILNDYRNDPTKLDGFSFKLGLILNRGFADHKDFQLFAASVNREAGDMARAAAPKSQVKNEWLPGAAVGGKVEVKATISMVKGLQTAWGCSTLVKFVTADGYPMTTFYSGDAQSFNAGAAVTVKGTVKRLEDGKFGKQTLLTRVKVVA
jgi:hypothetical protein